MAPVIIFDSQKISNGHGFPFYSTLLRVFLSLPPHYFDFNSSPSFKVFSVSNICILPLLPYPGAVIVAQSLDYETCRDYFLTVEARDGGTPPLSAITTVNINLTDVNDNAPMFHDDRYTAVLSEDATLEEFVVQVGLVPILFCMELYCLSCFCSQMTLTTLNVCV